MTAYAIVPATWAHVRDLSTTMRAEDIADCSLMGYGPYSALRTSVSNSAEPLAGLADGEVLCMFGVADGQHPWLLASTAVPRHARAFLRVSKVWADAARQAYPVLDNWVGADNASSIRWLRWLGFTITDRVANGLRYFHA